MTAIDFADRAAAFEPLRLLLVDDSDEDVQIMSRALARYERADFVVEAASSAEEGSWMLGHAPYDLVLLDYKLNGEDGLSFLGRLSALQRVPVIMVTGQGDPRLAARAIRAGAIDYFSKDAIEPEGLGEAIEQAVLGSRRQREREHHDERSVLALAALAERQDGAAAGHLRRMRYYADELGTALGLRADERATLRYGAILHDIGKVALSASILNKPGPLSAREWQLMRQHPALGEQLCAPFRFAAEVGPIVRWHHERWDGAGYLDGLAGEAIPLLARVVAVIDAFDVMTSDRPYRPRLPRAEVIRRLWLGAGRQWDPAIVACLAGVLAERWAELVEAAAKLGEADLAIVGEQGVLG